jgi:hypothetical protein
VASQKIYSKKNLSPAEPICLRFAHVLVKAKQLAAPKQ